MLELYITDLAAYNKGFLIGEWITLPMDEKQLSAAVDKVLRGGEAICALEYGYEKHEEYFITDWQYNSHEFYDIDEYENIYNLNEQLQELKYKPAHELKAISFLITESIATDIADAITKADDVHIYENYSMEDIAYDLMQESYQADLLPSIIANNIDYEAIARELEYDGYYYEVGSDIYEYVG